MATWLQKHHLKVFSLVMLLKVIWSCSATSGMSHTNYKGILRRLTEMVLYLPSPHAISMLVNLSSATCLK